uniref:Uncharacterized protein n=1 Tax=Panagrolaimus davidi TaxID=227884 RepID=A0A914Q5N3_9BILA
MEGDTISTILDSWPYIKQACERFPYLEGCLTESIIDNCLTFKQMYNPFSYSSHSTLGLIYHGANFICQDGYDAIKNSVMCATKHCKINQKNCSTIETSINKCSDKTKKICDHQKYNIFHLFLRLRECSKAPNCHFCKQANEDLYGILDRWFKKGSNRYGIKELKNKIENLQSLNEEIQLTALKEIHNDLSEIRPQIKIYIEMGIVPVLIQCLDSFNTSIQFEAISCLQKLGNSKIDHVEAIIDTGTLPQLVHRILTTESDEISGKIIEFFAILITIKPNLHEYYKDLKIVEPLLLSIFPETASKKIKTKIATILASISHENDWAPTLETRNTVEDLFPLLTELVNHHESEVLIDIIEGYIGYKQQKDDVKIYVTFEVFETLINFLGQNDSILETLIFQVLEFIKGKNLI